MRSSAGTVELGCIAWPESPSLAHQVGNLHHALPREPVLMRADHHQPVMKQMLCREVRVLFDKLFPRYDEIQCPVAKGLDQGIDIADLDGKGDLLEPAGGSANQSGDEGRPCFDDADPDFPGRGVGQVVDLLQALLQLVEHVSAASQKHTSTLGELGSARAPLEERHSEISFEIGNHLRYRWLRQAEIMSGARHAAALRHDIENMHVADPQPTTKPRRAGIHLAIPSIDTCLTSFNLF